MIETGLVSGSVTMLILKMLKSKDLYGYEMIDTLRDISDGEFILKAGTLYPLLHQLVEKGYLSTYNKLFGGRTRKYYALEKAGEELLVEKIEMWKRYTKAVEIVLELERD